MQFLRRFALVAVAGVSACPQFCPGPAPVTTGPGPLEVKFPGLADGDRPLLLFSGTREGACVQFEPHIGTPALLLANVSWVPSCPVEIDALAPGHGSYGRIADPLAPGGSAWFTTALSAGTLSITLGPVAPIPVAIWIVAARGDRVTAEALRDRQLSSAGPILEDFGPGFVLESASAFLNVGDVNPDCASADEISANPAVHDPKSINVYYVENYKNRPYSSYARNCWMEGQPGIIFVSWANENTPDVALAHEIGHALGLDSPPSPVGGHTNNVAGFDEFNLMYSGAPTVTNVSVGQSYATNFAAASWLNRPAAAAPSPVVRTCQDSWLDGPCPTLKLFVPSWP
jgi:hypothetical protein